MLDIKNTLAKKVYCEAKGDLHSIENKHHVFSAPNLVSLDTIGLNYKLDSLHVTVKGDWQNCGYSFSLFFACAEDGNVATFTKDGSYIGTIFASHDGLECDDFNAVKVRGKIVNKINSLSDRFECIVYAVSLSFFDMMMEIRGV